jgi:hypothetical protein
MVFSKWRPSSVVMTPADVHSSSSSNVSMIVG